MYYGDKLISDSKNKQRVKEIFAILADESNYPINPVRSVPMAQ